MAGFDMMSLLNTQSRPEQPALRVVRVPIASIRANESNVFPMQELELLAADIQANGLRQPLVLFDLRHAGEPGKYMLIDGERRYRAHMLIGAETAECVVSAAETEDQARLELLLQELTHRRATPADTMQGMVELKKCLEAQRAAGTAVSGRIRDVVAAYFHVSPAQVGRAEKIDAGLSPELKEEFRAGRIKSTEAYDLAGETPERQEAAARSLRETGKLDKPQKREPEAPTPALDDSGLEKELEALMEPICDLYCCNPHSCNESYDPEDENCVECLIEKTIRTLLMRGRGQ